MQDFEFTLRDYVQLFLRRWWVIALTIVACLVLALGWSSRQTPLYSSTASILINQGSASDIFDPVGTASYSYAERLAENEARLLRSGLVSEEAIERLGYDAFVTVTTDDIADVLEVTAESDDPRQAQEIAQTYAETYIDVRRERFASERLSTAAKLIEELEQVDEQLETAEGDELLRLQLSRRDLAQQYDLLNLAVEVADDGQAQIIDDAFRPANPFTPQVRRDFMLGGVLGLLLGAGGVLLVESLDRSVKSRAMLESLTPGSPNLALIPSFGRANERTDTLVALHDPSSTSAEAFRTLRAALQYAAVDDSIRVVQVASAHSAAGKTTIAANLAFTLAAAGQTVAVVDADLRRPRLHELFGVPQVPGLTSAIIGAVPIADCVHQVTETTSGAPIVVPSGPIPPGPAELLGSEAGQRTIEQIKEMVDIVILDTPPVLAVADAMVLSRYVDASILVVDAKKSKRADVAHAYDRLVHSGAPVIGTVLNRAKLDGVNSYGYGYQTSMGSRSGGFLGRRSGHSQGVETLSGAEIPRLAMASASRTIPTTPILDATTEPVVAEAAAVIVEVLAPAVPATPAPTSPAPATPAPTSPAPTSPVVTSPVATSPVATSPVVADVAPVTPAPATPAPVSPVATQAPVTQPVSEPAIATVPPAAPAASPPPVPSTAPAPVHVVKPAAAVPKVAAALPANTSVGPRSTPAPRVPSQAAAVVRQPASDLQQPERVRVPQPAATASGSPGSTVGASSDPLGTVVLRPAAPQAIRQPKPSSVAAFNASEWADDVIIRN